MTTATAQDRLRQIAILVSSVDATAARQILLHLPTDKARRVRELAGQLGQVRPEERRRILAEFQRSAAAIPPHERRVSERPTSERPNSERPAAAAFSQPREYAGEPGASSLGEPSSPAELSDDRPNHPTWTRLSPTALVRFVRHERPAVTAVVISQLAPAVAVEVLQHLPTETSREVLLRLSRLREIDPEAMQAIDEHLAQRLGEYQHTIESDLENTRRIQALLAAAPSEVRQHWKAILANEDHVRSPLSAWPETGAHPPVEPLQLNPLQEGTVQRGDQSAAAAAAAAAAAPVTDVLDIPLVRPTEGVTRAEPATPSTTPRRPANRESTPESNLASNGERSADILPFPQTAPDKQSAAIDRSLMQIEFEQILHLPSWMLAELLSNTDSQVVLLALAGATPQFMKRFMNMLDRRDARALQNRLQQIGAIRLRDVDDAQRQIVENAARWTHERGPQPIPTHRPQRAAA
jgi:flagellar motor switch protein FliG